MKKIKIDRITMRDLFNINGKVIVITGGTGVLGSVIATYLAGEGASVVILGRRIEPGEALVKEIRNKGGEALFWNRCIE